MGTVGVVFDTNVLVSAIGYGGTPLDALLEAFGTEYRIIASDETVAELERVMQYDRLPFSDEERAFYLAMLRREADVVVPEVSPTVVDADPDDDAFLGCAVAGDATYVVSGDDHLLDLGTYRDIEIVTPAEFLERSQ